MPQRAAIPASATCGDSVSWCNPRTPLAARAEMRVLPSEDTGVADAMIKAPQRTTSRSLRTRLRLKSPPVGRYVPKTKGVVLWLVGIDSSYRQPSSASPYRQGKDFPPATGTRDGFFLMGGVGRLKAQCSKREGIRRG